MSWFHHICDCGCNIQDVEYTNEGVILTCKKCGKQVKKGVKRFYSIQKEIKDLMG